jgi:hypothetical protein
MGQNLKWPEWNQEDWLALVATADAETLLTASTKSFYWKKGSSEVFPTTSSSNIAHLVFMAYESPTGKMHMLYQCSS